MTGTDRLGPNASRQAAGAVSTSERPAVNVRKVGIIGAGQMGNGISHVVSLAATTSC
jgi:hypothetical protein